MRRTAITLHTTAALTALAVLAPTLRPGYVLGYDMVFTPRLPFTDATLGAGGEAPRAVPQDTLVAVASLALRGDLLQKVALVAAVYLAVLGAARLVPTERLLVPVVAGVAYGWNAYLAERLLLGHWSLLLAYAALPWIVRSALRARRGGPVTGLVGWSALAAITPTGGILALVATGVVLGWPGRDRAERSTWWAVPAVALLNAPWLVAGLLAGGAARSDPAGVDVFAARAENWSGPVGALLGLGGVWNRQAMPASRESLLAPVLTLVVLAGAAFGFGPLRRRWAAGDAAAVLALAAGGLALALLGVLPGGPAVLRWLVETVPGAGLLRDGQKFLAPFALLVAVAFALGAERLADLVVARAPALPAAVLVAAAILPVVALPDLAWGGRGRLVPVHYPADWSRVAARLDGDGELVTLPYSAFRAYRWNGGRTSLDPADRYFSAPVVVDDSLVVAGRDGRLTAVAGESRRAEEVRRCVASGCPLPSIGIRWALVETDQPGADRATGLLRTMRPVYTGPTLALYESTEPIPRRPGPPGWQLALLVAAYLAAAGSLFVNGVSWALRRRGTGW